MSEPTENQPENNNTTHTTTEETSLTPQTPIRIEEFTLQNILENDAVKGLLMSVGAMLAQSVENDKAANENNKQRLTNDIELRKLDIKEQELDMQQDKQEQDHIKGFDIRNKAYTISILVVIVIAVGILHHLQILGTEESKTLVVIALTIGMTSNTDLIKGLFNKKGKED